MKVVKDLLERLWGVYALVLFAIAILFSLVVVTVVPWRSARHWLVAAASKTPFVLSGIRIDVIGKDHLPNDHCVVVANHASYVDGPLLKGFLPARFSFVVKGEMRDIPIVHFLFRRAGARFVERFSATGSVRDARQIVKAAQGGQSLALFPEGTFIEQAGVGRFRPGAFVAAVRGGKPVVPIAISGTRYMLPHGKWIPRPCTIHIEILPAISPQESVFADNRALAEAARQRILAALDEPDLLGADVATPT